MLQFKKNCVCIGGLLFVCQYSLVGWCGDATGRSLD